MGWRRRLRINHSSFLTLEPATAAIASAAIPAISPNPGNASPTAPPIPPSSSITLALFYSLQEIKLEHYLIFIVRIIYCKVSITIEYKPKHQYP